MRAARAPGEYLPEDAHPLVTANQRGPNEDELMHILETGNGDNNPTEDPLSRTYCKRRVRSGLTWVLSGGNWCRLCAIRAEEAHVVLSSLTREYYGYNEWNSPVAAMEGAPPDRVLSYAEAHADHDRRHRRLTVVD